jgi:membrane protein
MLRAPGDHPFGLAIAPGHVGRGAPQEREVIMTTTKDRTSDTIDLRDRERGATDQERGRDADAPQQIPMRGWKDVAVRVKDEAREDNVTLIAAGIAFFSLLSLVPAMVAAISLYGLVSTPEDVARNLGDLTSTMPEEARRLVTDQLQQVVSSSKSGLSVGLVVGLVVALWGASAAMKQLIVALSAMYDEKDSRGYVKLRLRALLLTVGGIAFLGISLVLLTGAPAWAESMGNEVASLAVSILRWPVLFVLMVVALSVVYRYAPDRDQPKWRWVSWGSASATVLWILASAGFSFYASHFGSYNKTYGSMAAVVVMMLWLYITALCVLIGAELNAELERQTAQDSTQGADEPLGHRDAYAADTVGAASD